MKHARHRFYKILLLKHKENKVMMQDHIFKLMLNCLKIMRSPNFIYIHLST